MSLNIGSMGLTVTAGIKTFDNTDAAVSVPASSTTILRTITGRGSAELAFKGDGGVDVTMKVSVDSGADISVIPGNVQGSAAFAFTLSLVIKAVNAGVVAENSSTNSSTGVYQ